MTQFLVSRHRLGTLVSRHGITIGCYDVVFGVATRVFGRKGFLCHDPNFGVTTEGLNCWARLVS